MLVVSASMGAGHDGAARELQTRLVGRGHDVQIVDFLDLVPLRLGVALRWLYQLQLRALPWTYELTYRLTPIVRIPTVLLDDWLTRGRLKRVVNRFRPAIIVSVYPLSSLVLGRMRRTGRLRVPVVTYLTDFSVHSLWIDRGVDRHLAISAASAELATIRGGRNAVVRGPLVGDRFHMGNRSERQEVRSRLGLMPDTRAVLVVAGSWGVGAVCATVDAIASSREFHPIVVCGGNVHLRQTLEQQEVGTIIGWTDEMPALMLAADVLVENAGGLTCMEAFASGLPVVTFRPIPGHGRDNAETMAGYGVSRYARDTPSLLVALREIPDREGVQRDPIVARASALFADDPSRDVEELANDSAQDIPADAPILRSSAASRRTAATIGALAMVYGSLTFGAQGAAAFGVGIAKAPPTAAATVYLGVRLNDDLLNDAAFLNELRTSGATLIVDAAVAGEHPHELSWLSSHGVDIANGGAGGRGARLRLTRARHDVDGAGKLIADETSTRPTVFAPGRRIDAFDHYYADRARQRVVVPDVTFGAAEPPDHLRAGRVYVLDARFSDSAAMRSALVEFTYEAVHEGIHVAPLEELR